MNRRSFLERSSAGAVAAYAALQWRASERPPEHGPLEIDLTQFHPDPGQEPTWWAECEIDGTKHRLAEIAGPTVEPAEPGPIDFEGSLDNMVLPSPFRGTSDIDMVLWAEESRFRQMMELIVKRKQVRVSMRLPDRPMVGRIYFDGYVINVTEPNNNYFVSAFKVTVRMTGLDKQSLPL